VSRRVAVAAVLAVSLLGPPTLAGVGAAQLGSGGEDCPPPTHAVVVDGGRPVVLESVAGCPDGRYVYDADWAATYEPVRAANGTDVRDAAPADGGGWWLLGERALHRVDADWRPTGRTVALPAANGSVAGPNETGAFRAVASGDGRLWLSGPAGVVVLDPVTAEANATDLPAAAGLYAANGTLWTLRGEGSRGGRVARYDVADASVDPTAQRTVRIGPEVRRPADLVRTDRGWLVVSEARNLFVYAPDWTYAGERRGSSGLLAALALLSPAGVLAAFGGVVVLRLRPSLLRRFGVVVVTSTVLALAVRQSLLPPAASGVYALPGAAVAAILLAPWALAVVTLRDRPRAVLAGLLLLGAGPALPVAAEFVLAV
jgi:hypothetical protein